LSAVNRRQPEISVNLPRELEMLESRRILSGEAFKASANCRVANYRV
jgi:hypothetical protein